MPKHFKNEEKLLYDGKDEVLLIPNYIKVHK